MRCAISRSYGTEDQPGQGGVNCGGDDRLSLPFLLARAALERRRNRVRRRDARKRSGK
jgi:hypothetical protein